MQPLLLSPAVCAAVPPRQAHSRRHTPFPTSGLSNALVAACFRRDVGPPGGTCGTAVAQLTPPGAAAHNDSGCVPWRRRKPSQLSGAVLVWFECGAVRGTVLLSASLFSFRINGISTHTHTHTHYSTLHSAVNCSTDTFQHLFFTVCSLFVCLRFFFFVYFCFVFLFCVSSCSA